MRQLVDSVRLGMGRELIDRALRRKSKAPVMPPLGEEILLPGQNGETHSGFVNCANNEFGLRARFYTANSTTGAKRVGVRWEHSARRFEGYPGIIHGGITASLLDELMTNAIFHCCEKFGVTTKAEFKWLKPLKTGDAVQGFGEVVYQTEDFARVRGYLFRGDGSLFASSDGTFYFPTLAQFKRLTQTKQVPEAVAAFFRHRAEKMARPEATKARE